MHMRNSKMRLLLLVAMITVPVGVFSHTLNNKNYLTPDEISEKRTITILENLASLQRGDTTYDSCHRPVITSVSILHPGGRIQVCYVLLTPCDSCTIFVYNAFNGLVTSVPNICGGSCTYFKFLDTCTHYRFLIKCHSDSCGIVMSDTVDFNGCWIQQRQQKVPQTPTFRTSKGNLGSLYKMIDVIGLLIPSQRFRKRITNYRKRMETSSCYNNDLDTLRRSKEFANIIVNS